MEMGCQSSYNFEYVANLCDLPKYILTSSQIYALYERSRKILIFLLVMCGLEVSVMAVLVGVTMSELSRELCSCSTKYRTMLI